MRFVEFLFLRGVLFVGLPVLLAVLLIGPARVWKSLKKAGYFLFRSRLEPEQILARVVRQHEQHVALVRKALMQAETTELAIRAQLNEGEAQAALFEREAQELAGRGDDLGARGALFKLNLERQAVDNYRRQSERQQALIADSRKRLFQIELQLRQYEVGRSILLSQLAQARTVEQQYAIAREFDPFNAIATWREAEGLVHEKAIQAQAIERVYNDIHEPAPLEAADAAAIEAQLTELKARLPGPGALSDTSNHLSGEPNGSAAAPTPETILIERSKPRMGFYNRWSFWIGLASLFLGLLIVQQIWHWEVERKEVLPGKFLVRVHRWGKNLSSDEIVAPDPTYKGIMLDVLPEGRHFLNPFFWSHEVHDMVRVEPGTCLVLTRKFGREIPADRLAAGDLLASEDAANPIDGERGILRDVKLPGSYRLNPYAYSWEVAPAVEIRVSQIGVRSLKVGRDPRLIPDAERLSRYVVPAGYRGVQQDIVPPGTYYINPYVETITPIDVRSHRVELSDIAFPSRDGFLIQPRVVVEYAVQADKAAEMLVRLTDAGLMHQADATPEQQQENEVLQKVILPHIRGYARIEGSNFDARDFILVAAADPATKQTNAREVLQKALLEKVRPRCADLGVEIRAVTLADLRPPAELSDQIAQRELARVELEKNAVRVRQFQAEQELKAKEELQQQAKEKVEAETRLVQAKTKAGQAKEVEESRLRQELASAQLRLEASRKTAEATLSRGRAEAAVLTAQNEAEVAGLRHAVEGFRGVQNYAQFQMISRLAPALSEIFASDDSEFARIFAGYMTPGETTPTVVPPAATAQAPEKTVAAP